VGVSQVPRNPKTQKKTGIVDNLPEKNRLKINAL